MTWSYRVIRKTRRIPAKQWNDRKGRTIHFYDVHEVYYNKNGKPTSWTVEPVSVNGQDSLRGIQSGLAQMLRDCLRYPILEIVGSKLVERSKNL